MRLLAGMAAIGGSVAWHIRRVVASRAPADAAAYVASRLLLLGCFAGSAAVLRRQGVDMHLHHLYLGGASRRRARAKRIGQQASSNRVNPKAAPPTASRCMHSGTAKFPCVCSEGRPSAGMAGRGQSGPAIIVPLRPGESPTGCRPPPAGWSLALWAELNHPLSAVTLAVGCGIFVQGIGAYSFAPVFQVRPRPGTPTPTPRAPRSVGAAGAAPAAARRVSSWPEHCRCGPASPGRRTTAS